MLNQKKITKTLLLFLFFLVFINCGVKDAIDETIDAVECANRAVQLNQDEDDKTCNELTADINNILRDCGEFLSEEDIESLNFIKDNCTDN